MRINMGEVERMCEGYICVRAGDYRLSVVSGKGLSAFRQF